MVRCIGRSSDQFFGNVVPMQGAGESSMRVLMRAVLLMFPGFSDHLPCDYEKALREEVSGQMIDPA